MTRGHLLEEGLTREVIGAFFEVYDELGFGFLEHVHMAALERELATRSLKPAREIPVVIDYKGESLYSCRMDLVVADKLIVEVKSTELLPPMALRQLHNYLRATKYELGLLLHFGPQPKFYRRILTADTKRTRNKIPLSPDLAPDP